MDKIKKEIKVFCYNCNQETNQKILFETGELISPEIIPFGNDGKRKDSIFTIEAQIWKISKCKGCDKINLNVYRRYNPYESDVPIHHFPIKVKRNFPYWTTSLEIGYFELFQEIYHSLNHNNYRLAMMGVRTLLDMFIVEKIGDIGTFKKKLDEMVEQGYISSQAKDLLNIALEFGSATIHRGFKPEGEEFNNVLDIVENIFQSEVLKEKTNSLKSKIPPRS